MATASLWKDMDDKFCTCSICLEQLKEPKLLPCLHRFCKDCLDTLLKASCGTLKCPECREEIQIPTAGVDGFKTDFYMKNLVEYVQIQQSLQSDETRECYGCSKHLRAAAYCFKCNNFLCTDCHHAHVTSRILNDHRQHTVSVKDIESKNITPEKLASMRDAPRCHVHPSKLSELFCQTCDNVPACVACMHGKHKGHDLYEVTELARVKRQMLSEQMKALEEMKAERKGLSPSKEKEKLIQNVTSEKEKLQMIYEDKRTKEETKSENVKSRLEEIKYKKKNEKQKIFQSLEAEMEREIQQVKEKYKNVYDKKETEIDNKYYPQENYNEKQLAESSQRLEHLAKDQQLLADSIERQRKEKAQNIEKFHEHFERENKRFENLNVMASNILASENDWTAAQCIPDLCEAATNLMKDLKREFPELQTLTDIKVDYQQSSLGKASVTKIIDQVENKFTFNDTYFYVNGATSSGDGNIVITGCQETGNTAFVIVVDLNGKIMKEKEVKAGEDTPWHVCAYLSQNKVALACEPNTIGVYNVCDGSSFSRVISDGISSWPADKYITCVATDPVNKHILVGGYLSRDVYVFDDKLNYLHILKLPQIVQWPQDITVSDGHLLVCDYDGQKSYVTTMEVSESKVVRELMKPDLGADDLSPCSVYTDKDSFVYILWEVEGAQCYLVQYIPDGSRILTTREVDGNAEVVTVVSTAQGEKLIVATHGTHAVYSYGLIEENCGSSQNTTGFFVSSMLK